MKTLVIDDLRRAYEDEDVTYARTPDEGIYQLAMGKWELICLDHDLGFDYDTSDDLTIWPCMAYIETHAEQFKDVIFYIITSNPIGAQRMQAALKTTGLSSFVLGWEEKSVLFTGG